MTELTRKMLCVKSGEFAMESVFTLGLRGQGVRLNSILSECKNLVKMDLAENKLDSLAIEGNKLVGPFSQLKFLDLSQNRLSSLDSFPRCERLEILHLEGNRISAVEELKKLKSKAPRLKHLYLRSIKDSDNLSNPVCSNKRYASQVLQVLPSLVVLDGMRVKFEFSLYKLEQALLEEEDAERRAENGERGAPASGEASDSKSPRIDIEPPTVEWLQSKIEAEVSSLSGVLDACDALCKKSDELLSRGSGAT